MANQFEKNYYATLGVPQDASPDELRKAYRELAKQFHPDAAPDNPYAQTHFAAISEAYAVLSDAGSRAAYDEERWLRGFTTRSKAATRITPQWIRAEAQRLRSHMAKIDTYRMNHAALRDYVEALLANQHLSLLAGDAAAGSSVFEDVLASVEGISAVYIPAIAQRLELLANGNPDLHSRIATWKQRRESEARWNKYRPVIVIVATALLCLILWWLSRP